jgi:signal transduction histidine kinase
MQFPEIKVSKLILLFSLQLLSSLTLIGQNNIIDSLQKLLATQQEDTNKALTLNRLGENLLDENQSKKSMEYSNASILLSHKLNFKRIEGSAYENRAFGYLQLGDFTNAEKDFLTAMQIRKDAGDKRGIAQSYSSIGSLYYQLDNYPKALQNLYEGLKIFQAIDNKKGIANTLFMLSSIYIDQGNDSEAIKNLRLTIQLHEESGEKFMAGRSYLGLAGIELNRKNYDEAMKDFFTALAIFKAYGENKSFIANSYLNIGYVCGLLGDEADKNGNNKIAQLNYNRALKYYDSCINIFREIDVEDGIITANGYKAKILIQQKEFEKAKEYITAYIKQSKKFRSTIDLKEAYASLANLDSAQGHYKEAFENYKMSILYRDSFVNTVNTKKALQEKLQYDFDKKHDAIKAQQDKKDLEVKRSRTIQYFVIASLGAVILVIFFIAYIQWKNNQQKQKVNKELQVQKEKLEITLNELKSAQAQLIQSEKMASLGELAAGVAHEIQNPLNFVNNFSEVNLELIDEMNIEIEKANLPEIRIIAGSIKENHEKINQHGKRADAIVKSMLQHSRSSTGQKELTDLNNLAEEHFKMSYHGFRAKDKFFSAIVETQFEPGVGKIKIIPQDIGRVFLNIFNNAFYAVNERKKGYNGALTETGIVFEPKVSLKTRKSDDKIEIIVQDNGGGIRPGVLEKIFQPFFTTKPTGDGTGLGLSLSYDIIKTNGGEITVKNIEGEGVVFRISLPLQN